ncbi:MFS transporter, partial [Xanthomonas perforans]
MGKRAAMQRYNRLHQRQGTVRCGHREPHRCPGPCMSSTVPKLSFARILALNA